MNLRKSVDSREKAQAAQNKEITWFGTPVLPSVRYNPVLRSKTYPTRRDPSSRNRWNLPFSKPSLGTGFAGLG
jgi:hypothetical protein